MTERLFGTNEVAELLAVTPSAVTNWRRRDTGPLPEPAFEYRHRDAFAPLWTRAQLAPIFEARIAELAAVVESLEGVRDDD